MPAKKNEFPALEIPKWPNYGRQQYRYEGGAVVSIVQIIHDARDLPEMEVPIAGLHFGGSVFGDADDMLYFISHMKAILDADLDFPILLDRYGRILDGRHRLARAIFEGRTTIKAKRFLQHVEISYVEDENDPKS